jgi:hypothetical protein
MVCTFSPKTEKELLDSIWEQVQHFRSSRVEAEHEHLVGIENGALNTNGEAAFRFAKSGAGVGGPI